MSRCYCLFNCIVSAFNYLIKLGAKINNNNNNNKRVSVLVQRFNGVLLHDSFVFEDCPE